MIRVPLRFVPLLLVLCLIVFSGCITSRPSANMTPAPAVGNGTPVTSSPTGVATATVSPVPTLKDHESLNVVRGEPFTITGTVGNRSVPVVQVWLLNGSISTMLVPVMPDGTFRVTLDAGE